MVKRCFEQQGAAAFDMGGGNLGVAPSRNSGLSALLAFYPSEAAAKAGLRDTAVDVNRNVRVRVIGPSGARLLNLCLRTRELVMPSEVMEGEPRSVRFGSNAKPLALPLGRQWHTIASGTGIRHVKIQAVESGKAKPVALLVLPSSSTHFAGLASESCVESASGTVARTATALSRLSGLSAGAYALIRPKACKGASSVIIVADVRLKARTELVIKILLR
jgi:hypothetical protein